MESAIDQAIVGCNGKISKQMLVDSPSTPLYEINKEKAKASRYLRAHHSSSSAAKSKKRVFITFGVHPRELISTEVALKFFQELCSNSNEVLTKANKKMIFSDFNIKMVPNSNRGGREKVEKGDYCNRLDEKGVDLNRNWPLGWRSV